MQPFSQNLYVRLHTHTSLPQDFEIVNFVKKKEVQYWNFQLLQLLDF